MTEMTKEEIDAEIWRIACSQGIDVGRARVIWKGEQINKKRHAEMLARQAEEARLKKEAEQKHMEESKAELEKFATFVEEDEAEEAELEAKEQEQQAVEDSTSQLQAERDALEQEKLNLTTYKAKLKEIALKLQDFEIQLDKEDETFKADVLKEASAKFSRLLTEKVAEIKAVAESQIGAYETKRSGEKTTLQVKFNDALNADMKMIVEPIVPGVMLLAGSRAKEIQYFFSKDGYNKVHMKFNVVWNDGTVEAGSFSDNELRAYADPEFTKPITEVEWTRNGNIAMSRFWLRNEGLFDYFIQSVTFSDPKIAFILSSDKVYVKHAIEVVLHADVTNMPELGWIDLVKASFSSGTMTIKGYFVQKTFKESG